MKKNLFVISLALLLIVPFFVGCFSATGTGGGASNKSIPKIDNATDLKTYQPSTDEPEYGDDEKYYTSKRLNFCSEIMGYFSTDKPFTVDKDNENNRIYDNLYLYEDDYFYIISSDYKDVWASLSNKANDYLEEEKAEGEDLQINVKISGIYKLVLDISTMKFDFEYKDDITTPVYHQFENCQIYSRATSWQSMTTNPENSDEFMIENFEVETGALVSFFNIVHTSNYKTTVDQSVKGKYIDGDDKPRKQVFFNIGGTYNVYINAKTYVVRAELVNKNTADYTICKYVKNESGKYNFVDLELADSTVPYVFIDQYVADRNYVCSLPSYYTKAYKEYSLTSQNSSASLIESEYKGETYCYFKTQGTYNITINLLDFTITVEKLPE